jgi:hypothetical protein
MSNPMEEPRQLGEWRVAWLLPPGPYNDEVVGLYGGTHPFEFPTKLEAEAFITRLRAYLLETQGYVYFYWPVRKEDG